MTALVATPDPPSSDAVREPEIVSMGCRLNASEADAMRAHARSAGLGDCVIVNTCAVTAESVRQASQAIRRIKRERPDVRILVTGCAAQLEPERFAAMPEVETVIGNAEKLSAGTFHSIARRTAARINTGDIMLARGLALDGMTPRVLPLPASGDGRTRAYVPVQNGCDHRCTFCIIPFARGPSRSVPPGEVVRHVAKLAEAGYREVVLTGVDITSYGVDLPGAQSLGRLVRAILRHVTDLPRLRLSSIDQVEADPVLLDVLGSDVRLMPHLHLSLQSGDNLILKRMKRRHCREDSISFCSQVRRLRPDIVFGADLIAGFPTETEAMHQSSLDLVEACGLTYLHVFPYSARPGTAAARMPHVAPAEIKARAAALRHLGACRQKQHLEALKGQIESVLMEKGGLGRTKHFTEVALSGGLPAGVITDVRIIGHDGRRAHGVRAGSEDGTVGTGARDGTGPCLSGVRA